MKRARLTYLGAFHHGMNRGIQGENILQSTKNKIEFLKYLHESQNKFKIRIFAYCIMDNHYHLILENSSGKMSDFFRYLNGKYGTYFRRVDNKSGYVFQNRYKSTLIQNESYLKMAIRYVLLNPVRAGLVEDFINYNWSYSYPIRKALGENAIDRDFVSELFGSQKAFINFMYSVENPELPMVPSKFGGIVGNKDYIDVAIERFERRKEFFGEGMQRVDDRYFEPLNKVIQEFEDLIGSSIEAIDISTYQGKRLRGELLVQLKDRAGLKYSDINKVVPFTNIRLVSLPKLYKDAKKRLSGKQV